MDQLIDELEEKIDNGFHESLDKINKEFDKFFDLMFDGGKAKLVLEKPDIKIQKEVEAATDPELREHEKEVEDMKQFLEDYGIEKLLTEIPTETDPQYWKEGSALLVSFSIKNVKIIETITKLVLE